MLFDRKEETELLPDPIITIGIFKVHMYGLMIAVGVLAAFAVLQLFSRKKKLDGRFVDFLFYDAIVCVIISFGSAVLFQAVYDTIHDPSKSFFEHFGEGMTFIGGLIGALIVFFAGYAIFRKKLTGRMKDFIPIFPCCITIAHAFGRVGCFFAGCCHGIHTGTWLDVKFPKLPETVLPTQLYEAIFLFLLFGVIAFLLMKKNCIHTMSIYLIAYGVFRFAIEFVRDDERGEFIGSLTPSQFWSVVMVIGGILLIFFMRKGRKPAWASGDASLTGEPAGEDGPEQIGAGYEDGETGEEAEAESVPQEQTEETPSGADPEKENTEEADA